MDRRAFLTTAAGASITTWLSDARTGAAENASAGRLRVAVIGHTGRGEYGHGLDTVWLGLPGETEVVAVADADAGGLAKAVERLRLGEGGGFADYRAMLDAVRPDLVAVCPRHADQHHAMALAAIEAGARGVYVEKPFCRTPAEADALVKACRGSGARLAVAHRNRWHPVLPVIDRMLADGAVGRLLEIRGRGKGDRRGGAEDLWVLGSHVLNLVHHFSGGAVACSAVLLEDGRPVTAADVVDGPEGLGPLAGDEVHARFRTANGVTAFFDSIADDGTKNAGFGLQLVGSEGIIAIHCDREPLAHLVPGNPFAPTPEPRPWIPISTAGAGNPEPDPNTIAAVASHAVPVRDLIDAVRRDREPLCNVHEGAATVEMIAAVFESHRQGGREVALPLAERRNALSLL